MAQNGASCADVLLTGFLPICQNQIQGLFKDFQGSYKGYIWPQSVYEKISVRNSNDEVYHHSDSGNTYKDRPLHNGQK